MGKTEISVGVLPWKHCRAQGGPKDADRLFGNDTDVSGGNGFGLLGGFFTEEGIGVGVGGVGDGGG